MGGIIKMTVTAIALPALAGPPAAIVLITEGRVFNSSLNMALPPPMAHIELNENSDSVIQPGFTSGITIVQNIRKIPAPSIFPASISESGMLSSMYCFIRKAPMAPGIAGSMYIQYVSIIRIWE